MTEAEVDFFRTVAERDPPATNAFASFGSLPAAELARI